MGIRSAACAGSIGFRRPDGVLRARSPQPRRTALRAARRAGGDGGVPGYRRGEGRSSVVDRSGRQTIFGLTVHAENGPGLCFITCFHAPGTFRSARSCSSIAHRCVGLRLNNPIHAARHGRSATMRRLSAIGYLEVSSKRMHTRPWPAVVHPLCAISVVQPATSNTTGEDKTRRSWQDAILSCASFCFCGMRSPPGTTPRRPTGTVRSTRAGAGRLPPCGRRCAISA